MAKPKTKKAKALLNPPLEKPQRTTAAEIEAMKKECETWQNKTYESCRKEVDKIHKRLYKECYEWQKKEPNELKDC